MRLMPTNVRLTGMTLAGAGLLLALGGCDLLPREYQPQQAQPQVQFNPPPQAMGPRDTDTRWYHVSFRTGSSRIDRDQRAAIDAVVREMRDSPSLRATLIGRADNVGADQANLRLSRARAEAVRDALVRDGRIRPERIEVRWTGDRRESTLDVPFRRDADDRMVDIALR